jgi:hypothetical protein
MPTRETKFENLHARVDAIQERRASGFWEPILWHLALRSYGTAQLRLADYYTYNGNCEELGRLGDAFSPLGMMYRAYRKGERFAGYNLALTYFNVGDMRGYRHWLFKAARAGDPEAKKELKQFQTRKPHRLARRLRRLRPDTREN